MGHIISGVVVKVLEKPFSDAESDGGQLAGNPLRCLRRSSDIAV